MVQIRTSVLLTLIYILTNNVLIHINKKVSGVKIWIIICKIFYPISIWKNPYGQGFTYIFSALSFPFFVPPLFGRSSPFFCIDFALSRSAFPLRFHFHWSTLTRRGSSISLLLSIWAGERYIYQFLLYKAGRAGLAEFPKLDTILWQYSRHFWNKSAASEKMSYSSSTQF